MYKIGVIGKGFVGSAVANGFSANTGFDSEVRIYDKEPSRTVHDLDETVNKSDYLFVSVPTPSSVSGEIDLSILKSCLQSINEAINENNFPVILIRSTVVPGTTRSLQEMFPKLKLVFNPEFLTERSAYYDFISQSRYILGGDIEDVEKTAKLYKDRFGPEISIIKTDYETAELIKYMCNTFFATKVSFMNEMFRLCNSINGNWDQALEGFVRDGRVGHSHVNVPGHDGKLGFGGSCFPKDVQALISFAQNKNLNLNVLEGAWKTNLEVRPEKDWEKLKGRAISD
jgi:nucleotide sugar dehydrogenase